MITQIYHKQNELFEVEFFKDEKCHQMITDWSKYPQIYVELKDGCMSPVNALCDNNIYRDTEYYIPYISHRYTLCKFRLIKTLDDITPNLSKYILEDNAVLFLSEGDSEDRKSTRLNSSHSQQSRMPSSA